MTGMKLARSAYFVKLPVMSYAKAHISGQNRRVRSFPPRNLEPMISKFSHYFSNTANYRESGADTLKLDEDIVDFLVSHVCAHRESRIHPSDLYSADLGFIDCHFGQRSSHNMHMHFTGGSRRQDDGPWLELQKLPCRTSLEL